MTIFARLFGVLDGKKSLVNMSGHVLMKFNQWQRPTRADHVRHEHKMMCTNGSQNYCSFLVATNPKWRMSAEVYRRFKVANRYLSNPVTDS